MLQSTLEFFFRLSAPLSMSDISCSCSPTMTTAGLPPCILLAHIHHYTADSVL